MGYPGDNDQPPWDNTPLETDPWSRHPLSAPVSQPQPEEHEAASWHGTESGSTTWGGDQQAGSWLENAAAPPQPPAAPEWSESQQPASWGNDPLSAPTSFSGPNTGAQAAFTEPAAGHGGWPESPLDGPSGPQATPWQDAPQPVSYDGYDPYNGHGGQDGYEASTGTHALPSYDQQSGPLSAVPYDAPSGALSAQPQEAPGGTQAFPSYDPPSYEPSAYEAPNGALSSQPFTGAQAVPPQQAWQEQPHPDYSGPHQALADGQPPQPPYDGYSGPQQAAPWQGNDGFGPNEQWPAEGGSGFGPDEGGKSSRKPLIFGAVVVAAVVVAGGAWAVKNSGGGTKKTASPSSSVSTPGATADAADPGVEPSSEATSQGGMLASRKTDPKPLSLGEVFRKKRFTEKGITYVMTIRKKSSCKDAVHGSALQTSLSKGKCTQFLRATFTTAGGKMIGTVGVANLATAEAATKAAKAATAKDAYVIAVPAKGVTSKIGQGDALGAAWTRGHYLIMTWVQLPNGKAIPAKFKKAAQTFAQSTVAGSNLGPALHIRDETGKPGA